MNGIKKFFRLEEHKTTISKEIIAGLTTFFAMAYIIAVNPFILGDAGMPMMAVALATIFASIIGTLVMGLFANVPYALAPGMGLNAFFAYVICGSLGFVWQEALMIVLISGVINVLITVTKVRKSIIKAIPVYLQQAIGGGIGIFIAYIGLINSNLISVSAGGYGFVPDITKFEVNAPILAIIGLVITIVLLLLKVKGAILIGILATTLLGWPLGVTQFSWEWDLGKAFGELGTTMFAAFDSNIFADWSRIPLALVAVFALSLSDTFDTIGTFIGTGRKSGIFTDEDVAAVEHSKGFKTRMERALFADSIATSIGALLGTSNTTTYVESAAGIEEGGKTGLTSVVTALMFAVCILIVPFVSVVPAAATAPALIIVGVMMAGSFTDIKWNDLEEAIPAFLTVVFMGFAYNISIGIAFGFIFHIIVKVCKGKAREVHPIIWGSSLLFLIYFLLMALNAQGVF